VPYTLGSVPYLNAKPLVRWFEEVPGSVSVVYDVPSRLPRLLEEGEVQAILVSSIEALRRPDLSIADDVAICSEAEVLSVRLFSKNPIAEIRRLALDASSMTSNALARIVLARRYGVEPEYSAEPPELSSMLREHDAALLIGDKGMKAEAGEFVTLDLGAEWRAMTDLPFVWALWVGEPELAGELGELLREARRYGEANLERIAREEAPTVGLPEETCRHYLSEVMSYRFGPAEREGFDRFRQEAEALGLLGASPVLSA